MNENFSNGLQKLYNCLSKGVGVFMIPQDVKGVIDKEAKQISMIELNGEIADNITELYNDSRQPLAEVGELYKRTCSRVLYQEMRKQQNIENIVSKAEDILQNESEVSEEEVNQDWLMHFFNSVQDIGDEDMQKLWGKVLAGEIKNPNSFTLRSLDTLSKITKHEAILFEELRPYIINYRGTLAILNIDEINEKYNISYGKIVEIAECGLIDASGVMQLTLNVAEEYPLELIYNMELLRSNNKERKEIKIPIYKLTQAGKDIFRVVNENYNENYFKDVVQYLAQNNQEIIFTIHNIVNKSSVNIEYVSEGKEISVSEYNGG